MTEEQSKITLPKGLIDLARQLSSFNINFAVIECEYTDYYQHKNDIEKYISNNGSIAALHGIETFVNTISIQISGVKITLVCKSKNHDTDYMINFSNNQNRLFKNHYLPATLLVKDKITPTLRSNDKEKVK